MLHSLLSAIELPNYSSLRYFEGKGNFAIKKYYQFPYSFFYKHKLKMITSMMDRIYHNILDYGSGPGIFTKELKKHALFVTSYDINSIFDPRWKFDVVVCASVLEFVPLYVTLGKIAAILKPNGILLIASPMKTKLSEFYFKSIKDINLRHSHIDIKNAVHNYFHLESYKEWLGLYFAIKARK